jgi:hypothetical protein
MGHAPLAQLLRDAGADEARAAACGLESVATCDADTGAVT